MLRNSTILLLALVLALLLTGSVTAQSHGADHVRRELERTDQQIQQAGEAVHASNSAVAAQAVQRAISLQESAWEAFEAGSYAVALTLTRKAREQLALAVSNSRQTEQMEGVVQRRLERAADLLDRAQVALAGYDRQDLTALLESARVGLERGWEFFRGRQYRPALKLAEQVEQAAQKLLELAQQSQRLESEIQRWNENVERQLEYARELLAGCESRPGQEHMRRAEHTYQLARELYQNGNLKAALQALKQARDAARLALRECQGADRLAERLEQLRQEAERVAELLKDNGGEQAEAAEKLLNQAYEQLDLAARYLSEENIESAQVALQAAQLALRQARRYITGNSL